MNENRKFRDFTSWKTKDAVTTVVLALAAGILNLVAYQAFRILTTINPMVATSLLSIIYLPFLLVLHIVRRAGSGLLAGAVIGLAGIPFSGSGSLIAQIVNGLFAELPYTVTGYQRFDNSMVTVAGILSCSLATGLLYAPPVNLGNLSLATQILAWTGGVASGIAAGAIVPILAKFIDRAGVLHRITAVVETDTALDK